MKPALLIAAFIAWLVISTLIGSWIGKAIHRLHPSDDAADDFAEALLADLGAADDQRPRGLACSLHDVELPR